MAPPVPGLVLRYVYDADLWSGRFPSHGEFYTLWDYFIPSFQCPHRVERIGMRGDGGKWVCGMDRVAEQQDCVIYSFGESFCAAAQTLKLFFDLMLTQVSTASHHSKPHCLNARLVVKFGGMTSASTRYIPSTSFTV